MSGRYLPPFGFRLRANLHGHGAARMESAAWRYGRGGGHVPVEQQFFPLDVGMIGQGGGEQSLGIWVERAAKEFFAFRHLDKAAQIHDSHHVAHVADCAQVVRNEEVAESLPYLKIFEEIHNLGADGDVQ